MSAIFIASLEESRHLGLAWSYGLPCLNATARADGSGAGTIGMLTVAELRRLHAVDASLAVDIVTSYAAVAVVGGDQPSPVDQALAAQAEYLYRAVVGRDPAMMLIRAETRATKFCVVQQAGIQRFAAELASAGYLAGVGLQRALERCFARERAQVPAGAELGPWIAARQEALEAERQAARKAQSAKDARALAAYFDAMGIHQHHAPFTPQPPKRSQSATLRAKVWPIALKEVTPHV